MAKTILTPATFAESPPKDNKGSSKSLYNGEAGLPKRTPSPNAVPEVTRDGALPKYKPTGNI